ncbi:MAG: tetratricopeptide repeat protein [Verrucomicrobiota bacterium]
MDDIGHGRRHIDLIIGGSDLRKAQLWVVLPNDFAGSEVDPETLRGVSIAVTGKIESSGGTPQITIKSTTDIQARSALQTNYIGNAYDKETKGDLDGAIEDLNQAIEHQPVRRDEACQHLAGVKAKRGDWAGALAAYDRLVSFDPNNSDSYYTRATAKKQHGDFEAAMADYEKVAELRSSSNDYIQMGNLRKEKGDMTGAAAEYDKAIALCDRQIAGTAKSYPQSPLGSDPYFGRGWARELKGDLDGALPDYTQAIANDPARAAMAYGARGNLRRARGDLSGAIADYQHKYQITHYPDDKQKLEQASAEARTGAKKVVVTQSSIQAAQKEQPANKDKDKVSPDSIATAFVQAYSGADVDTLAGLYADRVDHTNSGVISNAAIRKQAQEYFARWPVRQWSLAGLVKTISLGGNRQKVIFSASYDASDPQTNKHASGIAQETLILASDKRGAIKIVSQKEQTSKTGSSQPDEQSSEDRDRDVAKAEYGQQTGFTCKLVGRGSDIQLPRGYAQRHLENGVEILRGNDNVPAVNSSEGVRWAAALGPDGKLLWAAKVPYKPPRLGYGLATNGDHLWETAVLDNGVFQLARFKAGTLEREASVQTAFQVTESAGTRTGPAFEFQSQTEGDLQVSVHRMFGDSAKVVVFSRELRPILDKIYSVPDRVAGSGYLIRLPDRTGYYLVIQPQVSKGKRGPRIGIIQLDNTGAIKWANAYNTGYSDNDITTRVTNDGALLVSWGDRRSTLMKIRRDGAVNWATTIEDILVSFDDSAYETPAPYRFTEPSLLAVGIQQDETDQPWWLTKKYSVLFRLNYETGNIEKQIKFGANTPGRCSFVERDANSFYVGFGNEQWLDKPTGHGSSPNRVKDHGAALRFDYDFNLLAARKIRDAGPILVFFHLFAADRGVISYPDAAKGTLMVETTNANFESSSGCQWLEKENFTFTKSNFQQHPTHIDSSPLTVTVSDANSKLSQADLTLTPFDLGAIPCQPKQ